MILNLFKEIIWFDFESLSFFKVMWYFLGSSKFDIIINDFYWLWWVVYKKYGWDMRLKIKF